MPLHRDNNHIASLSPQRHDRLWCEYLTDGRGRLSQYASALVASPIELLKVDVEIGRLLLAEIADDRGPDEEAHRRLIIDVAYDLVMREPLNDADAVSRDLAA